MREVRGEIPTQSGGPESQAEMRMTPKKLMDFLGPDTSLSLSPLPDRP